MKHYTTAQLADLLGMHPRSIADDRRDGSLGWIPFTRIGRAVRYRDDDVQQWLDQRRYIGGADTSLRAGSVPTGAHNPGHAGSTPAPATSRRLDGIAGARPRTPGRSAARPGTGADSGDSRERPAQPMQRGASGTHGAPHRQAGSTPAPATNLPTGAARQGPKAVKAWGAVPRPENGAAAGPTRDVSDASESSARRDSRERPAPLSAPARVPPTSSSLSSTTPPVGAVSVNARMGRR